MSNYIYYHFSTVYKKMANYLLKTSESVTLVFKMMILKDMKLSVYNISIVHQRSINRSQGGAWD